MTNLQAVKAVLQVSIPDNSIDKALIDRDVTSGDTYTKANAQSIDLCAMDLLVGLLSTPDVSEGGYSIKFDRAAVLKQVLFIAGKYGVTDVLNQFKPTVTSKDVW